MGEMSALGFELRDQAVLETLTQDVLKSSEIEGELFNREQVRSSIARRLGLEIGALSPADRDVDGVVEMMHDATRNYDATLTKRRLLAWHTSLFPTGHGGMRRIEVGAWRDDRNGPMQVTSGRYGREAVHFEAPAAERVDREMAIFLAWFNSPPQSDPVLKAALAHLWFVTIHPSTTATVGSPERSPTWPWHAPKKARSGFTACPPKSRRKAAPTTVSSTTQKGTLDVTDWMEWFLRNLDQAFWTATVHLTNVPRKARFWETHAGEAFNDRQTEILNRLLDGFDGKLTSSKWAKLARHRQSRHQRPAHSRDLDEGAGGGAEHELLAH